MSRIQPPEAQNLSSQVQEIFKEVEAEFGMVPNLFRTYAHYPPLLEANWNKVKAVMVQGDLNQKVKQTIAVLVSKDNSCAYCVAAHTGALKSIGVSEEEIQNITEQIDKADFNAQEQALIRFARKASREPLKITGDEFDALRKTGVSDAEIIEALGVMELFTSFNRFLDALQVDIDF
ncbi:MAG: peroxidase-related enzyme [Deltaproteobacteria bacterium]|nr:peroxidase-related enzyme [Deltaproteobacteria bacterium]